VTANYQPKSAKNEAPRTERIAEEFIGLATMNVTTARSTCITRPWFDRLHCDGSDGRRGPCSLLSWPSSGTARVPEYIRSGDPFPACSAATHTCLVTLPSGVACNPLTNDRRRVQCIGNLYAREHDVPGSDVSRVVQLLLHIGTTLREERLSEEYIRNNNGTERFMLRVTRTFNVLYL